MKFSTSQSGFQKALHLVASVVPGKSTLPILETVLVEVSPAGEVTLTATDLDISVRVQRAGEVEEGGRVAVAARRLHDVVRELRDAEISLTGEESGLTLRCASGRYRFVGAPVDDFPGLPEIPDQKPLQVDPAKMERMVRQTLYAVSTDETRPELTGLFLSISDDQMSMVATNGHRLARASLSGAFKQKREMLLPPKALNQLLRLIGDADGPLEISGSKNYARIRIGSTQLYSRLLEGPFPDYEKVIPKSNPLRAVVRREDLLASLRRILVLSDSQTRQVKIMLEPGRLQIMAQYQGAGEAQEELPVDYDGTPLTIGYNGGYLLEMLKTFDGERVEMAFQSAVSAGLFKPAELQPDEDLLCLVMPLRLPGDDAAG
ncbi:MAG: DNA polymerase III subunit beta [Candidatus Eisenbacteria bacterium]|uniref:Beta sliding clamp n=1 Tax=Eiseniibacteriota bacterium TaxID=2212470 RepID=A0A937XA47_UNCEI|nr:DNA polymerase III subunit beta [Candidatus Eisenbacteria bacterium]